MFFFFATINLASFFLSLSLFWGGLVPSRVREDNALIDSRARRWPGRIHIAAAPGFFSFCFPPWMCWVASVVGWTAPVLSSYLRVPPFEDFELFYAVVSTVIFINLIWHLVRAFLQDSSP